MFASGFPDANVVWTMLDSAGGTLATDTITPVPDDVSCTITVPGVINTLAPGTLYDVRDLCWNYTTGGVTVADEYRFILEARIPFGARPEGVRAKLGITLDDMVDDEVELMKAYLWFENDVGESTLAGFLAGSALEKITIANAIEASAALTLLPTLQVRLAQREASGTNQYQRGNIDWARLQADLEEILNTGIELIDPSRGDPTTDGDIFLIARPAFDPFTGA